MPAVSTISDDSPISKEGLMPHLEPRVLALKCRSLAQGISDDEAVRALNRLADEYEAKADASERQVASGHGQSTQARQTTDTSSYV